MSLYRGWNSRLCHLAIDWYLLESDIWFSNMHESQAKWNSLMDHLCWPKRVRMVLTRWRTESVKHPSENRSKVRDAFHEEKPEILFKGCGGFFSVKCNRPNIEWMECLWIRMNLIEVRFLADHAVSSVRENLNRLFSKRKILLSGYSGIDHAHE